MKKVISAILTLCMIVSMMSVSVYAVESDSSVRVNAKSLIAKSNADDVDLSNVSEVTRDLQLLSDTSFGQLEKLKLVGRNDDGHILFEIAVADGVKAKIFVYEDAVGNRNIDISENGIHNVITYIGEDIYVDGNKVIIDVSKDWSTFTSTETDVGQMPRIASSSYSDNMIYVANYALVSGPTTDTDVSMGMKWINTSLSVVMEVLGVALTVAGLDGIGNFTQIYSDVASWAVNQGAIRPSESAHMSFRYYTYSPSIQPTSSLHWKLVCTYYAQANCEGSGYTDVFYENYYY